MNRKPREPLPETVDKLRGLLERKQHADTAATAAMDDLALAAWHACEVEGASRRRVAAQLGVSSSTVQNWVVHGRQLRG